MSLLGLNPTALAAKAGVAVIALAGATGFGYWLGMQPGKAEAEQAKLVCSQTLSKQVSDAAALQQARQAEADKRIAEVTADVERSEKQRAQLEQQVASLRQSNAKLAADLAGSRRDLGLLKQRAAAYSVGAPGSDSAACAAISGRARVLGDLVGQSIDLLNEAVGLLETGTGLANEGSSLLADTANDAEQLASVVRGWQAYYGSVVQLPQHGSRP